MNRGILEIATMVKVFGNTDTKRENCKKSIHPSDQKGVLGIFRGERGVRAMHHLISVVFGVDRGPV